VTESEPVLEITQDYEMDFDGELGSPMPVFWSYGWHDDTRKFIEEVVQFCLDEDEDIPRITADDVLQRVWQLNRATGQGVMFIRESEPVLDMDYARNWKKVTVLDLYALHRGARMCMIHNCKEPWSVGLPVRALMSARAEDDPNVTAELYLCRGHRNVVPEPSYRIFMVPVGATVVMPTPEDKEPAVKPIDLPGSEGSNTGHGHVYPRPDGARARCGGPSICKDCARDLARKESEK